MKIEKLSTIKNLGIYNNFTWDDECPEFKQFNFFYGWNYSGKTSLSRVFRCLEEKELHHDYPNLKFTLQTDNGNISEKSVGNEYPIRVFNEDFVLENFKWNDETQRINPVLILGKESIELQEKLTKKEEEKKSLEDNNEKLELELNTKEKGLKNSLTAKAREIRNILGITNQKEFDKNVLENKIEKINKNINQYILDDEQKLLRIYRNQTKYVNISLLNINLKINYLYNETKNICERQITAQQIIKKLRDNPELNRWVRNGIDLHRNEEYCQFCGNKLPDDLFERLNKHFSEEYDKLIKDLNDCEKRIKEHKNIINKTQFTDKERFYPDFSKNYEKKIEDLKVKIEEYGNVLDNLLEKLQEKIEKPFERITFDLQLSDIEIVIRDLIDKTNKIIHKNNDMVEKLDEEKRSAKQKLLDHYTAKAEEELKYFDIKSEIEKLSKQKKEIEENISVIDRDIEEIKSKILTANVGVQKINEYLTHFFRDDQIKLKPLDDSYYQVRRSEGIAKNLSTGEKNIISLIYFMTRLEENNFEKQNAVIFIDDPVSSLDSNHMYQIYGFLGEKLNECGQVFITTHNFDFFNLLKDMVEKDPKGTPNKRNKNDKENYYLIKKVQEKNNEESEQVNKVTKISRLPGVLSDFKSEYNYFFYILKTFDESKDKTNFELLYILPNIARRFLEAYLFAKYPDGSNFKNKTKKFFEGNLDDYKKQSTMKILDEYSHEQNPEHDQKFPDINEVEIAINTILTNLKDKDEEHYIALEDSLKNKN